MTWIEARWDDLHALPFTAIPVGEIRRPEFVDTVEDLPRDGQDELTTDLVERSMVAADGAPVVCHLDSGVRRSHVLLSDSLDPADVHSVVSGGDGDHLGHGTLMAGLALDYHELCDTSGIEDPAHAWNALTVGAYTVLTATPSHPSFASWTPLASEGDISPHSRTSLVFRTRLWPVKPDICMEGGNVLSDGVDFHDSHPLLSVRTTSSRDDLALTSANATSAATAQAARLAAKAMAAYPSYWPETIRGLLVHAAEWTPAMRVRVHGTSAKTARQAMLRRYGWGVPSESAVLASSRNAVTLVTQDEFVPFDGTDHAARRFRLHRLPWPAETLRELAETAVQLRVTLSYFIEPTASRRGWRRRYAYPSHGFRFELKAPLERPADFVSRINREAQDEEAGARPPSGSDRWFVGNNQRNLGSLHQDIWEGTGGELADCGLIAVHPVGGWWKNNKRTDRADLPLRYSLIVSLRTAAEGVDLYTPIAVQLAVPVEAEIEGS